MRRGAVVIAVAIVVAAALIVGWRRCDRSDQPARARAAAKPSVKRVDRTAATRGAIAGTVRDGSGAVIANARVCATVTAEDVSMDTRMPRCVLAVTGSYRFENLRATTYSIDATARERVPASVEVTLADGEVRVVDLVLSNGAVELSGTVSDLAGGPIRGAFVQTLQATFTATTETDEAGHYSIWVKPASAFIQASADGYTGVFTVARAPNVVDLQLTPESTLAGVVLDATTLQPVAGLRVAVDGVDEAIDTTDERGQFRLTRLVPSRYSISATGPGYRTPPQPTIRLGLAQSIDDVRVLVVPAYHVTAKVMIAGAHQPCTKGVVTVAPGWRRRAIGADGTITIHGLEAGPITLVIACDGYQRRTESMTIEKDVDGVTWTVGDGARVTGRVRTNRDLPLADVHVSLTSKTAGPAGAYRWASATTDADGGYEIRGVANDRYEISARSDTKYVSDEVEVRTAVVQKDFVFDRASYATIRGVVLDANRRPLSRVQISALGADEARVDTDLHGGFEISNLPAGTYTLRGFDRRYNDTLRRPKTGREELAEIVIGAGQVKEVELVAEAPVGAIRGSVVDRRGNPVTDVFVLAVRTTDPCDWVNWGDDDQRRITSGDGSFVIPDVLPGRHCVHAYHRSGVDSAARSVEAGGTAKLVLEDAASIRGTVTFLDGTAPTQFRLSVNGLRESFFQTNGRFTVGDLAPGNYEVIATAPNGAGVAKVTLAAADAKQLPITLRPVASVTGRLLDYSTKQPLRQQVDATRYNSSTRFESASATSDASGRFALTGVPVGSIIITVEPMGDGGFDRASHVRRNLPSAPSVNLGDILVLQPRSTGELAGTAGFTLVDNPSSWFIDHLQVATIDANGPAARSGLRAGDVIVSVDGIDVRGESAGYYHALMQAPPGTRLSVGLERGATVELVLANR